MNHDAHFNRIKKLGTSCKSSLLLWPVLLIPMFMGFGAPGSEKVWSYWLFSIVVISLPFVAFVAPRYALAALNDGQIKLAYAIVLVPMAILLSPLLAPLFWWIGYAVFHF